MFLRHPFLSLWTWFLNFRTTPNLSDTTQRLIREADVAALRRAGAARVVVAGILLIAVLIATEGIPVTDVLAMHQVRAAEATLTFLGAVGLAGAWAASRRVAVTWLPSATATLDALLIFGNVGYSHFVLDMPGGYFAVYPGIWVIPITMAAAAIHYSPRLQAYVAVLYVTGLGILAWGSRYLNPYERQQDLGELSGQFGWQANAIRVVMVLAAGLILILVARQGRLILERAVREATLRANLMRYVPRELAPILSQQAFASLREGRRMPVTLLFVDIRASSALGEGMDPTRLATFMSSFRRRVMRAAAQHGGVIDKFIGDGALILFGVPNEGQDDTARALACGRTLLDLIGRWNVKRGFSPPLRIGIGIHTGEVFCGVVGDEDRLEFTVLGEAVNIASRIEQATKTAQCDLLASQEAVCAAGEEELWTAIEHEQLPGVTRKLVLMKPA